MKREAVTEAERVYVLASALLAESPDIGAEKAVRLAVLFIRLFEEVELFRYHLELLQGAP